MKNKKNPIGRKDDIVVQEHEGEVLIYDLRNDKAFCLNETSALIWHACDGSRDVSQISELVAKRLNATASEDLVWLALDQLKKEKLIDSGLDAGYDHFKGMSRREAVRKVAVGSAVAIPIIAGLVAPQAYAIGSACGNTCTCRDDAPGTGGMTCNATPGMGGSACPSSPPGCPICYANSPFTSSPGSQAPSAARAGTCSMT